MTGEGVPTAAAACTAPRITIVDDDRENRERLCDLLQRDGYEVTEVSSGLRLISSLQVDRPDLLILEAIMSWMDGFTLCRALKKHPDFKDIPIVFLSARSAPADLDAGRAAGCADYLTKPVNVELLRARVRELIGDVKKKS